MRSVLLFAGLVIVGCGDVTQTCGGHGACAVAGSATVCTSETGAPNAADCYLPPSEGPGYANLRVEPSDVAACQQADGRQCVINWQWN